MPVGLPSVSAALVAGRHPETAPTVDADIVAYLLEGTRLPVSLHELLARSGTAGEADDTPESSLRVLELRADGGRDDVLASRSELLSRFHALESKLYATGAATGGGAAAEAESLPSLTLADMRSLDPLEGAAPAILLRRCGVGLVLPSGESAGAVVRLRTSDAAVRGGPRRCPISLALECHRSPRRDHAVRRAADRQQRRRGLL
jgi:hypothetical protein